MFKFITGSTVRQYATVVVANFGFFQFGITVAWSSPAMVHLSDDEQKMLPKPITVAEMAWVLSISFLGTLSALAFMGFILGKIGRKYAIVASCVPRIIACLLLLFSSRVWMLLLGKVISGVADSFVLSATAAYTLEIANKEIRGGLGTVSQISSAIGSMLILSIGPFVSFHTLNLILTSSTVFTLIPMMFLPESPYFLYSKGKTDEAIKILIYFGGTELSAREEINEYTVMSVDKVSNLRLLKDWIFVKTLFKVLVLSISSQITGYNCIMLYLQTIFEYTGTTISPEISSLVIGCIQVVACFCTILLTDRLGRKPVLITTLFFFGLGMIGIGVFFRMKDSGITITGFFNYLPVISVALIIFCYNAGIGSIIWTLMAELFEGPSRIFGVTFGVFTTSLFTFLTIRYFSSVIIAIGPATTYWIFSGFCFLTSLFILICIPETKGRSFKEIQVALGRKEILDK